MSQEKLLERYDVAVIGGGNAALVAAMCARNYVENVVILERAPIEMRGGNTRHTRNVRCVHLAADAYNTGSYSYEEMWDDLCMVGQGPSNEELASLTVKESQTVPGWMSSHGISWQPALKGTLHLGKTNRFFLGGGKALINAYHQTLAKMGIKIVYDAFVEDLEISGDLCTGVIVDYDSRKFKIEAGAVVCASGGYEANLEWLARYWGDAAKNYLIRGPKYNDGVILRSLYEHGAAPAGQEKGFHAVAVDARSPRFDGGIATRLDTIPFGIVVNKLGRRFYDEGEEIWPKRYAMWGRLIAEQPDQIAFSLWDSKVSHLFLPPMYEPVEADSIRGLAQKLGLCESVVQTTIEEFNSGVSSNGTFNPTLLDSCFTTNVVPCKSHWAQRFDKPPYYGIAMRPGITFTYMGVAVTQDGRVLRQDQTTFKNVFAAGEIMSGNILSTGYLAGFGLTIGTVWGRISGKGAAIAAGGR